MSFENETIFVLKPEDAWDDEEIFLKNKTKKTIVIQVKNLLELD